MTHQTHPLMGTHTAPEEENLVNKIDNHHRDYPLSLIGVLGFVEPANAKKTRLC